MSRYLILEDDANLLELLVASLECHGHEVHAALDVAEAEALLHGLAFDALILDVFIKVGGRMSSEGGLTLINRVRRPSRERRNATRQNVRIVCMSGALFFTGNDEVLRMARQLGADVILNKPFTPAALFDALSECWDPARIEGSAGVV